jgi:hypothetical protein
MPTQDMTKTGKMWLQPDSLLTMAMFDLDKLGRQQENLCPSQQQAVPSFHPVDTGDDLSLKELFDSDGFLSEDEDACTVSSLIEQAFDLSDASEDQEGDNLMNELLSPIPLNIPWGHDVASYNLVHGMGDSHVMPAITMSNDIGNQGSMHNPITDDHIAFDNDVLHRCTAPAFSQPMGMLKPSYLSQPLDICAVQSGSINNDRHETCSDSDDSDCRFICTSRFTSHIEESYLEDQWTEGFNDLCRYREEKGNCLVPHNYEENLSLARWVKRYRNLYKQKQAGKSSALTAKRIKDLDSIGFVWDKNCAVWEGRLDELRKFCGVYKHCNVPLNYSNQPLVNWVRYQRRQCMRCREGKHSTLTPERTNKLDSLSFVWSLPHPYKRARTV